MTELRRRDLHLTIPAKGSDADPEGVVRVERAVVRVEGRFQVTTPKSDAGVRDVAVPPHLVPYLQRHLDEFVPDDPGALLFPAAHGGHWRQPRSTGASTPRAMPQAVPICAGMTYGTPVLFWPPRQAPRSPS